MSSRPEPPHPEYIGPYRLAEMLGEGGMGRVYRAYDERLDRWVAAKCLHHEASDTSRRRFRREAHTLARLGHPAIVQIFDIVEDGGNDWIIMEMVQGRTLAFRSGPIEWRIAIDYGRQILSALEAAHSHGIVHRDLKTDNIMVLPSGHVKVLDFGLAYHVDRSRDDSGELTSADGLLPKELDPALTEPGRLLGTPRTMAPEQVLELEVDERADLYSFGVLLYECITGQPAFSGKRVPRVLYRVVQERLPTLRSIVPTVPRELSDLIDRLLEKDPTLRPGSAAEVGAKLALLTVPEPARGGGRQELYDEPPRDAVSESEAARRSFSERRHLTVLCCDLAHPLAGSRAGSSPDLETLAEVTPAFLDTFKDVIVRYQGTVSSLFGSRFIAFFGYPIAHEDSAVRAVHAGLELVTEGRMEGPDGKPLSPRIGIHTGPVVITPGQSWEPVALGATLDHAIEIQAHAGLDAVAVSDVTRQVVARSFSFDDIPEVADAWRVLASQSRWSADQTIELPPLVARDHELDLLLSRWQLCTQGRGQVMLISGEAGIGKSRLLWGLRDGLPDRSTRWWTAYGSPFQKDSPFAAVADMLRQEVLLDPEDDGAEAHLRRLEAFLDAFGLADPEVVSLFANLLELPEDETSFAADLPPNERRRQILEALVALFSEMAEQRAWVLAIEDLHWLDPSSLELLGRLVPQVGTMPLCVIATSRPDGLPSWELGAITRVHLDQLGDQSSAELLQSIGGGALPAPVREQILGRADGIPLFLEELTKAVLESESEPKAEAIPSTLRDSLTSRLDRLGSAKEMAETAATIGRTFSIEMLRMIDPRDEQTLRHELDRLIQAGLVFRKGFKSSERFLFKHALIHDIAYDSLLRKDRQALHRLLAEALAASTDPAPYPQPELVAHHFARASRDAEAVPYWRRAGHGALAESAHLEALHHFERALACLDRVQDRSAHRDEELTVLSGLGTAQILNFGFTAPAVEETWNRANDLCLSSGDAPSFDVLWGLYAFRSVRAEWHATGPIIDKLLRFAEEQDAPLLRLQSHFVEGIHHVFTGDPRAALDGLDRAATFEDDALSGPLIRSFAIDSRVMLRNYRALAAWLVGDDEQLATAQREAAELAASTGHAFTRCTCSLLLAILHLARRDGAAAETEAERVVDLSQRHGLYQDRDGRVLLASARVGRLAGGPGGSGDASNTEAGNPSADQTAERAGALAADLEEGLQQLTGSGSRVWSPLYLAYCAEAHILAGDLDAATVQLDAADRQVDDSGEVFWSAELLRLRGEVEALRGDGTLAKARFGQALDLAGEQGASALAERARRALDAL